MKKCLKLSSVFLLMIISFNFSVFYVNADDNLYAWTKSSILLEVDTGTILAEDDADKVRPPASLSKLMTFLLVQEALSDGKISLDDKIVVGEEASKTGNSSYRLRKGETVDLRELIESMMIVSANCSAVAIGQHISGNTQSFVKLMNSRAKELGMKNTHYINPHGLPVYKSDTERVSNMTTARDLAILSRYLLLNFKDETLKITRRKTFTSRFKNYQNNNTNPFLGKVNGIDGLKTGYTGAAGYCLAFTKEIKPVNNSTDAMRLIGITLGAGNNKDREKGSKILLDYGKDNFFKKTIITKGDYIGDTYFHGEKELPIKLLANDSLVLVKKNDIPSKFIKDKSIQIKSLKYPIEKGEKIGKVNYTLYDNSVVSIDLISDTEIEKIPFPILIKIWWDDLFDKAA